MKKRSHNVIDVFPQQQEEERDRERKQQRQDVLCKALELLPKSVTFELTLAYHYMMTSETNFGVTTQHPGEELEIVRKTVTKVFPSDFVNKGRMETFLKVPEMAGGVGVTARLKEDTEYEIVERRVERRAECVAFVVVIARKHALNKGALQTCYFVKRITEN